MQLYLVFCFHLSSDQIAKKISKNHSLKSEAVEPRGAYWKSTVPTAHQLVKNKIQIGTLLIKIKQNFYI